MKRVLALVVVLAGGCSSTVVLGTLAISDGGGADLADMPLCTVCDQALAPTDLAPQDLGDLAIVVFDGGGGVPDLAH